MLKNIKIACILVLDFSNTFYGIFKANFIMEGGKPMPMVKDKNQESEFSLPLENIDTKETLRMAKEVGMGL